MASTPEQIFTALLRSDRFKDHLFPHLSTSDLCALRQASSAFCNLLTKPIFARIRVSFSAHTFTKQSRVAALARIGHHIEHLTFYLAHSEATFLPPLIHPVTGNEISFLYTPHTSMGSVLTRPKYANTELGEILTQQYPPLFHAATNVPSFINAMRSLTNMRHLTICCPGQDPKERYRRGIVDYALISLRIALERAPLDKLKKLSLSSLHPAAFNYIRHMSGFGCVPSAAKRWRQIKKLHISVEAWDFYGSAPGLDHLKVIDDYIRFFAPSLEKLSFTWLGTKGPCPVALNGDPLFSTPTSPRKLFHEVTSPMSPLPMLPGRASIHFPQLRYLQIRNAVMHAPQLKELISSHRKTVREFDFKNVVLSNSGSWDDALSPVQKDENWARGSLNASSECSFVTNDSADDLPSPSAAAAAASRELLDFDLGIGDFERRRLSEMAADRSVIEGLSEEVADAREASLSFSTNLRKKRIRRRRTPRHSKESQQEESFTPEQSPPCSPQRYPSPLRPKVKRSLESVAETIGTLRPQPKRSLESVTENIEVPEAVRSNITAPILDPEPHPVLLQPTVYDPAARQHAPPEQGISSVQRNIEQEEAHRRLAEDASARTSALRKAKAALLSKLSREFGNIASSNNGRKASRAADAVSACRLMTGRDFGGFGSEVLEDRRGLESQSILVPLIFSRA